MDRAYAYIKVNGTEDYSLITDVLGLEPTSFWNVGDKRRNGSEYDFSHWAYQSPEFEGVFLDDVLEKLISFIEVQNLDFSKIPRGYEALIQVAGWHKEHNPSLHLSKSVINKLKKIDLAVDFDLYCENQ